MPVDVKFGINKTIFCRYSDCKIFHNYKFLLQTDLFIFSTTILTLVTTHYSVVSFNGVASR